MGEWEQGLAEKHLISHTQLIIKLTRARWLVQFLDKDFLRLEVGHSAADRTR